MTTTSACTRLLLCLVLLVATILPAHAEPISLGCLQAGTHASICDDLQRLVQAASQVQPRDVKVHVLTKENILDAAADALIDYAIVDPTSAACLQAEHSAAPIATLADPLLEGDGYLHEVGGVIFAKADSGIDSFNDLVDRVVAAPTATAFSGIQAQFFEYRQRTGRDLIDDAVMMQFYNTSRQVVDAVLEGKAEAGAVPSGTLEELFLEGTIALDGLHVLSEKLVVREGRQYPYFTSTPVYPNWALIAMPSTSIEERNDFESWLLLPSYNSTEHLHFAPPLSYTAASTVLTMFGVIIPDATRPGLGYCQRFETAYDAILCPADHYKLPPYAVDGTCDLYTQHPCPPGVLCVCRPCKKALPVEVHPVDHHISELQLDSDTRDVLEALSKTCSRMEICLEKIQNEDQYFLMEDNEYRTRPNKDTYYFLVRTLREDGSVVEVKAEHAETHPELSWMEVSETRFGIHTVQILLADDNIPEDQWEHLEASPFLMRVLPRECPPDKEATQLGTCGCPAQTLNMGGKCLRAREFVPIFLVIALVFIAILSYVIIVIMRKRADALWHIDSEDIVVSDPPDMLGRGAFGVVIKGELNGTAIAIKRAIPRPPSSKSGSSTGKRSSSSLASDASGSTKHSRIGRKRINSVARSTVNGQKSLSPCTTFVEVDNSTKEQRLLRALTAFTDAASIASVSSGKRYRYFSSAKADFMAEIRLLSRLRHPCVATMLGAIFTKSSEVLLVMEYLEHGSLYDFLRNDKLPTPDMFLLPIVKDIVSGMRYIHNLKPPVVHGDLKAKNVLVDGNFKAKIADFGLSQKRRFGCGTPYWMAPEVLRGGEVTREADVYSFAITVYEIYSRQDPFAEEDASEVLRQIAARQVPAKRPDIPDSCPVMLAELARRCWSEEPKFRPTFDQVDAQLSELNISKVGASLIQQKQDALKKATVLHDVFPPHIAKMLEEGKKVHPEHKDDVTIFFSDIVGFTNISAQLTPAAVSDMLDRLYSAFDELTEKHGVFKVETIGDAYMAATNLVEPQHDHALRIAQFAEDAIKAAQSTFIDMERPELGCVNIRVGFHCGPVVANVVGRRNPRYCLFGDTVNTASRMESSSERNKIHVSTSAGDRVRSQAPWVKLESRGVQNIKGKGEMLTYWLVSTKKEASGPSELTTVQEAEEPELEVAEQPPMTSPRSLTWADQQSAPSGNAGSNQDISTVGKLVRTISGTLSGKRRNSGDKPKRNNSLTRLFGHRSTPVQPAESDTDTDVESQTARSSIDFRPHLSASSGSSTSQAQQMTTPAVPGTVQLEGGIVSATDVDQYNGDDDDDDDDRDDYWGSGGELLQQDARLLGDSPSPVVLSNMSSPQPVRRSNLRNEEPPTHKTPTKLNQAANPTPTSATATTRRKKLPIAAGLSSRHQGATANNSMSAVSSTANTSRQSNDDTPNSLASPLLV
ncbi:TKL/DICTY4 protein kinase [Salpingoeca rosetta]|uniref:guanylate cyclase n=1 Tax=Salpingoeca rosetta (strain ATCC 50818 / BSB-021) TaxID=946362 RepID=F2UI78_SALR5|nr:TKL/DICTY4 protein kinase [Salpingoeca rosetta]EGD76827.1 TKL/DICTY4 protein kinase [Salpingoeca rosetta]|eukprot:XP_004991199.1 TKL/DICTY4 protein kinase [Salpingoeca rosetta]